MFDANLFVGSAGVSSFETALNKVPSILFQVNDNQKVQPEYMEKIGHFIILKLKENFRQFFHLMLIMHLDTLPLFLQLKNQWKLQENMV